MRLQRTAQLLVRQERSVAGGGSQTDRPGVLALPRCLGTAHHVRGRRQYPGERARWSRYLHTIESGLASESATGGSPAGQQGGDYPQTPEPTRAAARATEERRGSSREEGNSERNRQYRRTD